MKKYNFVIEKVICIANMMHKTRKTPRDFGIGQILYQAEIHTVTTIRSYGDINANELAKIIGVTSGAVTQMVDKLVKKGLVERYKFHYNKKEVYFRLTEQGEKAARGYDIFHKKLYKDVTKYLDALPDGQVDVIVKFLDNVIANLPTE